MITFDQIFVIAGIQALYDFAGWFIWIGENKKHWFAEPFRVTKWLLDYPATILVFYGNTRSGLLAAFYYAKICGLCDSLYILYWYIVKDQKYESTREPIDWFWWSFPVGWILTAIASIRARKFTKGTMKLKTFWYQVGAGILVAWLISSLF